MRGVEFYHPDIRRIAHENEALFSLASVPDEMGEQYSCENLGRALKGTGAEPPVYGNYSVTAFQLKLVSQDTAVLYMVWKSESNQ